MRYLPQSKDAIAGRKRVPCPLDPHHSVWEDQVQHHLKKCRARPAAPPTDPWFSENFNVQGCEKEAMSTRFKDTPINTSKWIETVRKVYEEEISSIPLRVDVRHHKGLDQRLGELANAKHAIQQASLIGHMDDLGMLEPENTVVEFGSGRGELSRYVSRTILLKQLSKTDNASVKSQSHVLIDRASNRMKLDSKITKDFEELVGEASVEQYPEIMRIKADIKDIKLDAVEGLRDDGIAIISKHLCGCATDLTLQCLRKSSQKFKGLVIALCCRQLCTYETFPEYGRRWLSERRIDAEGFYALARMTSWAVCGSRRKQGEADVPGGDGLTEADRHQLGMCARRILDTARVEALRQASYDAEVVQYVDPSVSPENHCLIIRPTASK